MNAAESVVAAALQHAAADPPRLRECFQNLNDLSMRTNVDDFKTLAPSLEAVWDAAWYHRAKMDGTKDLNLVGMVAVRYVALCSAIESFRPWDNSHLPHLLLHCAVNLRSQGHVDPLIEVLCRLTHGSPGATTLPGTTSWATLLDEVAVEIGTKALSTVFLRILKNPSTHSSTLQAAIELRFPKFLHKRWSSADDVIIFDVLDSLYSVAFRTVEDAGIPVMKKAGILCTFHYFEWNVFKCGHIEHLTRLLSGRYDVFGLLCAGLLFCSQFKWHEGDNPEFVYGTLERLLLAIEGAIDIPHTYFVNGALDCFSSFKSTIKELTRQALLGALCTPPVSIGHTPTAEATYSWNMLRESLICFSMNLGVHPYCANVSCDYRGRPLPENSGASFKKCGGCTNARYCSKDCQKAHCRFRKSRCGKSLKATSTIMNEY